MDIIILMLVRVLATVYFGLSPSVWFMVEKQGWQGESPGSPVPEWETRDGLVSVCWVLLTHLESYSRLFVVLTTAVGK